jgi:RNA polymerase sigma-70 factor (ECF subfamily)
MIERPKRLETVWLAERAPHRRPATGRVTVVDSDQVLIEEIRAGSTGAFEKLMKRYERLVYGISYVYTGDQEDSLDITQNVFLKVYEKLESFRSVGTFKAWLMRITHNENIDWTRSHARYRKHDELTAENAPSYEAGQESELARTESRRRLMSEMLHLNSRQREAVMLRYFGRMSIREISSMLNCTEGTTKSLLFRSLEKLRGRMVHQGSES